MSLTFPGWYVGGWPVREDVVQAWLTPLLATVSVYDSTGAQILNPDNSPRRPTTCSWLPANYSADLPLVAVYGSGGVAPGLSTVLDPQSVLIGAIGNTRDDSWALLEFCVQMLLTLPRVGGVKMPDGSHVQVTSVERTLAPELRPDVNPDNRLVIATLKVDCRLPRSVPDYGPTVAELAATF
ncbi:hypothetical protein ACFXG4_27145 [Nocardia sp. NPDC059246]|uniref:phage tail termination protein n=1 Tax=unclassified Nocardia TaxID=2637762 RepID=UPI00368FBD96